MDWGAGRPEGSEQVLTGTLLLHLGGESCVGYSATRSFVVASVSLTQQHVRTVEESWALAPYTGLNETTHCVRW